MGNVLSKAIDAQLAQRFSVAMAEATEAREEARRADVRSRETALDIERLQTQSEQLRLQADGIADLRREIQAQRPALCDVSRDRTVLSASGIGASNSVAQELCNELRIDMGNKISQLERRVDGIASMNEQQSNVHTPNVACHGVGDSHGHRSSSRMSSKSSDTDISALRPRSVSAERPPSALRQQQLRATEAAHAYGSNDPLLAPTGHQLGQTAPATPAHGSGFVAHDPLLKPRTGADADNPQIYAPPQATRGYLDVITERPSMERPSTQGTASARPSLEYPEAPSPNVAEQTFGRIT